MADVKWIKIVVDLFDDDKILMIESYPEHDAIIVIWFKLLCFAGKTNNSGVFIMNNKIAYTDEMLAAIFRRPLNTVRLALNIFEQFGMIEKIDNVITIPNWSKHQTLEQLENRKEYMRDYMQKYRDKQRLLVTNKGCKVNSKVNSKPNVNSLDIDIDKEVDKEEDKEVFKRDKLDKLDKTTLTSCVYNSLTNELIRRKFISESDLDIYRYDELLSELMQNYEYQDLLQVISYVIKNMKNKDIDDKFNYFNTSVLANLSMLNTRKKLKYTINRETT